MKRVQTKLVQNQIPHFAWEEPDFDLGFTSITTVPLDFEQKQVLKNYRVYNSKNSTPSFKLQDPVSTTGNVGENPTGVAN